jgi:uncharacterized delta-60 repeat protein
VDFAPGVAGSTLKEPDRRHVERRYEAEAGVKRCFLLPANCATLPAFPVMRAIAIALQVCWIFGMPWLCPAQVQQAWVQRYRAGTFQHLWGGPVLAANGDVCVTGLLGESGDSQFATVKYDAAGNERWVARYNGLTNETDTPSAVRLMPDGHVIVSGKSGPYQSNIFATVKYSPSGAELWAQRHNVVLDGDPPTVLAVTVSGDVYVAGATSSTGGNSDIVTLKYSSGGICRWAARFTGLAAQNDTVSAIAADANGNAYITGRSYIGGDWDYYVVKYDTNGTQSWVARYDGPFGQLDVPAAILVDGAGNVYVTGTSLGQGTGGMARYELATIKYDPLGSALWVARYAFPGSENVDTRIGMSFDPAGNILIAGSTFGAQDSECTLLKYDPGGARLWTARFNGAPNSFDGTYGLAVDGAGASYLTGISDGSEGWQFVTLKYDQSGNRLWAASLTPDGVVDFPVGIAVHSNGDVYVAGQSRSFEGPGGFLTVKYGQTSPPAGAPFIITQPAGQMAAGGTNVTFDVVASGSAPLFFQWRFNGMPLTDATNRSLVLSNLVLEQSGHYSVEVRNPLGSTATPEAELLVLIPPALTSEPQDQFAFAGTEVTFAVSAFGTEPFAYQWFHDQTLVATGQQSLLTLTNLQSADAGAYRVVVSNQSGSVTSAVAQLTVSLQVRRDWVNTYDGPGHSDDVNPLVKVDAAGNVYVAGTSSGVAGTDVAVIKYDPLGSGLWTARFSVQSNSSETVSALAVDASGNLWVAGTTTSADLQQDALTLKFDGSGTLLWVARFGTTNLFETANALALDNSGNGYVVGQTGQDFLTIKYDASGNQMWVGDFNGSGHGIDTARSVAVAGTNIYVTGSSWNGSNLDFLTLNYNAQGAILWQRAYDAAGADHAVAVVADVSGNVIVAGSSYGTATYGEFGTDYVVVKYAANGDRLWSARYDGFMNSEDYPTALAVDSSGHIYVTGHSDFESGDSGVRQFATLKYDSSGRELWRSWHISRQYDGSRSLALDSGGNVYITSLGTGAFSGRNIAFIKYDSLGNRVAMAQYNGFENSDDTPSALALDSAGNVLVTGTSSGASDTGLDFVLIKYSQNTVPGLPMIPGVPQSLDVAVGSNATFLVTAVGEAPLSFQWLFNGAALPGETNSMLNLGLAQFEQAGSYSVLVSNNRGMVVSPSAMLVVQAPPTIVSPPQTQAAVAGSAVTFAVTADGSPPLFYQWFARGIGLTNEIARTLTLPSVQPDAGGEYQVVVSNRVGTLRSAPARLIVTPAARQCWQARYNGPPGDNLDALEAMAVDGDGRIYVTGFSVGPSGADYLTIKYDTNGAQLWVARYNGPGDGHDFAADIAIDVGGNVYVTGRSWGGVSGVDIATVKYDTTGNEVWVARFDGPDNLEDVGRAIALDARGHVYVTGSTVTAPFNPNFITIQYSPLGAQLWMRQYDAAGQVDEAADIAVDSDGRVYVAGTSTASNLTADFATLKYDTNGTLFWSAGYSASIDSDESAAKLRLDPSGNVYVGGTTRRNGAPTDYAVVKYSPGGDRLWDFRFDGPAHSYDYFSDLLVDGDGNVYVNGTSEASGGGSDHITVKLSPNGERIWLSTYSVPYSLGDVPGAMTFDSLGNICVAATINTGESIDTATLCYDTNGCRRWTAVYAGSPNHSEFAMAIGADQFGHIFVAGSSVNADQSDYFAVKYGQEDVAGLPSIIAAPRDQSLRVGDTARFGVTAAGDGPLTYRWLFGKSIIAQGNITNILVNNVSDAVAGYYSVEVFNSLGWVASPAAELRVNGPVIPSFQVIGFTNGYPRLVLLGERDFVYQIQSSTDLLNWEIVSTNTIQNSSIEFIDSTTGASRFYRAVKLP